MGIARMKATTYKGLVDLIGEKKKVTVGHNTTAEYLGDMVSVRYHGYPIALIGIDGSMLIDHFGWVTVTTSGRLNQFVSDNHPGARVNIKDGVMVYTSPSGVQSDVSKGLSIGNDGEVKA